MPDNHVAGARADVAGRDVAVVAEQVRLLLYNPADVPINVINAGIVGVFVWPLYPAWVIVTWFAAFFAVSLARMLLRYRYLGTPPSAETALRWAQIFTLNAVVAACLWGLSASVILVTPDPVYHVFIIFVLGGTMAGGIVSTASYLPSMLAFMLPTIVPAIVALVLRGGFVSFEMAFMLVLFTAALTWTGRSINKTVVENIRLRIGQEGFVLKLRSSEAAMADAQAIAGVGSWTFDARTKHTIWTRETFRIYGVDPKTFDPSYEAVLERVHPLDRAIIAESAEAVAHGTGYAADHRIVMDDGAIRYVHAITHANRDAEGRLLTLIGTVQDITDRRNAEVKLQFASSLLEAELQASPDGILVVDSERRVISFNERFVDLWHVPIEDLNARNDSRVLARVSSGVKNSVQFEARVQYLFSHPGVTSHDALETVDGRFIDRYSATLMTPTDDSLGRVWYFRDVTERQVAANELAYRDRLLHAVTDGTGVLIRAASLAQAMPEALRILGESMHVDRVSMMQNASDTTSRLRYRWESADVRVPLDEATFAARPIDSGERAALLAPLREGKPVIVQLATSRGSIRATLEHFQNKSTLLVPIFVGENLWGALGVDACSVAREWTASEIDTLRTFGDIAGALVLRDEARLSLEKSEERFRVLSATAQDAIITIDGAGRISRWNQSAERILGYRSDETVGRPVHEFLVPPRFQKKADEALTHFVSTGEGNVLGKTVEMAALRKDGVEIAIEISLAGAKVGGQWQAIGILRDITERKEAAANALRMARYDVLTGLANRSVFVEAISHAIAMAKRGDSGFAVIYLDLDHFKDVNDTLGHPVGDELLKAVADRLRANTRESDTVARFGGDEFAVVVGDNDDPASAAILAAKLIKAIADPFSVRGSDIRSGASIGIASYGPEAPDAETLLSHADVALYRAKSEGRGSYRFFTAAMDTEVQTRVKLGTELRDAIDSGQLFLVYQPQVAVDTGRITGVEALVRWRHPVRGVLGPSLFIPIAEQIGIISKLGHWVLWEACRQGKLWLDAGIRPVRISVNVSALQFRAPIALEADIAAALAQTGLPPKMLELELTESVLMDASREHSDLLQRLRNTGVTVAIDDFGTGYSSLDYLHRFPSNRIKIAQNFVSTLETTAGDAAIVKATIGLARELGIEVIAEGVETQAQCDLLRGWGCGEVQGFHFARPLAVEDATVALRAGTIAPATSVSPPVTPGAVAATTG